MAVSTANLPDSFLSTAQSKLDVANSLITAQLQVSDLQSTTVNVSDLAVNVLASSSILAPLQTANDIHAVDLTVNDLANNNPYIAYQGLSGISFLTVNYDTTQNLFVILSKTGATLGTAADIGAAINSATTFLTVGRTYNQTIKVQPGRYALTTTIEMADNMTLDLTEVELYTVDDSLPQMIEFDAVTRAIIKGGKLNGANSVTTTIAIVTLNSSLCKLLDMYILYGYATAINFTTQMTISNCIFEYSNLEVFSSDECLVTNCKFLYSVEINSITFSLRNIVSNCQFIGNFNYALQPITTDFSIFQNCSFYKNQTIAFYTNTCGDIITSNCIVVDNNLSSSQSGLYIYTCTHGTHTNNSSYNTLTQPPLQLGALFDANVNSVNTGGTYHDNIIFQLSFSGGAGNVNGTNITIGA